MCSSITFRQLVPRLWFLTLFLWLIIPGGLLFPGRCTWLRFAILLRIFTTHCSIFNTVLNVVSTLMSAWLLRALPPELCFYTVERGPGGDRQIALRSPVVHRAMIKWSPCGGLTATKGTSASHRQTSFLLYTPLDLRAIIRGEYPDDRTEIHWSPLGRLWVFSAKFRTVAHGSLPEGRISEWPQTSADHPPNFNCELNLPGRRRTSARWGLCRRITAGFFAGFDAKLAVRWPCSWFLCIGTSA